jgi:hypothetical protein
VINLILALVWTCFGVGILVWQAMEPMRELPGLNRTFLSIGAFVLALYNLVRWWFTRPKPEMDWLGRRFPPRKPPRVVDYNPELDFSGPVSEKQEPDTHVKKTDQA